MNWQTKKSLIIGTTLIFSLLLAACTGGIQSQSNETTQNGEGTAAGQNLPSNFEITIYQGENFQEGQVVALTEILADDKPLVLNFWAGLCPPCRLEMPDFQEVYEEYQSQVVLLGVDVGPFTALGTREDGQVLLEELGITYPSGTTFNSEVIRDYEILGMPTTFFITPEGEVVEKWTGILTSEKMGELVEELIEASSRSL